MNWQEVLEEIHSVEFDVNLNVVSGTNRFFKAVSQESSVLEAYRQMRQSGEVCEDVLGLIYTLVKQETNPHFENPNDTPLAVLLWLTTFAAPDYAEMAATWVDGAPRCWYAKKLAQRILNPPPSTTGDYRFWEKPYEPRTTAIWSKDTKFTLAQSPEETLNFYGVNLRLESSTPATTWKGLGEIAAVAGEGTS